MRWLFAGALVVHGIAHLAGFAVAWHFVHSPEVPYKTTVLGGLVDVGDGGARTIGLLWLALTLAFLLSAYATIANWASAFSLALSAITASAVLCAIALPEAGIGLAVNVVLVIVLAIGPRAGLTVYDRGSTIPQTQGALR